MTRSFQPVRANARPLAEIDKASIVHPFTVLADQAAAGPRIIVSADRITLTDDAGRNYLDASSGLWCVNVGYGRVEIAEAMAEEARRLSYGSCFGPYSNEPLIRLTERLLELGPRNMTQVFFANSGSEANDTQIKLAWLYNNLREKPRKKKIIARRGAYHGTTLGAGSLGGHALMHGGFDLPLAGFLHTECPDYHRRADAQLSPGQYSRALADTLDRLIEQEGPDTVAAFVAEPVMGAGGVLVPPEGYFDEIGRVLAKHDVLLVADEVITGFGRTGHWFACQGLGFEPDLVTLAKGLTSAYVPMSACLISEKLARVLTEGSRRAGAFGHGFTTSGHPVAAAAALKNLEIMEREDLVGNAQRTGAYLLERLRAELADHPLVGEVRGLGLMAAVELDANKAERRPFADASAIGARLGQLCYEEGLLVRGALGKAAAALAPSLVLDPAEADEIVRRLSRAVARLADQLRAEGVWRPDA